MPLSTLSDVFGSEMLSDESLKDIFDGLVGFTPVKPFECVGTVSEIINALMLTAQRFIRKIKRSLIYSIIFTKERTRAS